MFICELNILSDLVMCAISDEAQPELSPCTVSLYERTALPCPQGHLPAPNLIFAQGEEKILNISLLVRVILL